jgi:hypothetical protein
MRILLLAFGFATVMLTSCTNYQYVQVKSDLPQTADTKHYYSADDHIYIDYDFAGYGLPVNLFIVNESNEGVYFDLLNTTFLENDEFVASALDLSKEENQWTILIEPKKSITYKCYPFAREYNGFLAAGSEKRTIANANGMETARVKLLEPGERSFTIRVAYRVGDEESDHRTVNAVFWEDQHVFTTSSPQSVALELTPNVYVLDDHNVTGQIATELLYEAVSASLAYLIYTGLD